MTDGSGGWKAPIPRLWDELSRLRLLPPTSVRRLDMAPRRCWHRSCAHNQTYRSAGHTRGEKFQVGVTYTASNLRTPAVALSLGPGSSCRRDVSWFSL